MIVVQLPNTNPHEKCYTAGMKCLKSVCKPELPDDGDCCLPCLPLNCTENDKVYCKDKTGLIAYTQTENDTVEFRLCKNNNLQNIDVVLDGSILSTLDIQENRYYLQVCWDKVFAAHGIGKYTVKINYNVVGVEYSEECEFILMECNPCDELGLVKIEYWINGSTKDGRLYCDDYFSFRVPGSIKMIDPIDEVETYKNKERVLINRNTAVYERWELQTHFTTESQGSKILKELAHAYKVKITGGKNEKSPDYELIREQGISINNPSGSNKCFFTLNFVEKSQTNMLTKCK